MPLDQDRADDLFLQALEVPKAGRDAFLESACGDDAALHRRIRQMIEAHERLPTQFMAGAPPIDVAALEPPTRIASCTVIREIGRGGMGVIYEAEQDTPHRRVAVKVVRPELVSEGLLRRFRFETEILAQLEHPGIARVYEAGTDRVYGAETPYIVMELIDGLPLDRHVERAGLDRPSMLELVARVCDAVQHAHVRGVIHRDLKPANILVQPAIPGSDGTSGADAIGQPKVLDFGIARLADGASAGVTIHTHAGVILGTLDFMSPEQFQGRSTDLDTRSDVYALGVILYRLLAGRSPFDLSGKSIAEAAAMRRTDAPRLGSINPALRGELETIVAKAIDPERERRYASAGQLADDIRRHLRSEPILAHPPSTFYQLRKFSGRNKALVSAAAVGLVVLVLGALGTSLGLREALATNRELERSNDDLRAVTEFQAAQLQDINPGEMGRRMRSSLIAAAPQDDRASLESAIAPINFTEQALKVLREDIFTGYRDAIEETFASRPLLRAFLLETLGKNIAAVGLYDEAIQDYHAALDIHREQRGPDDPDAIRMLNSICELNIAIQRYDTAGPLVEELRERSERVLGPDHAVTWDAIDLAGVLHAVAGEFAEAERCYQRVVDARIAAYGRADPRVLETLPRLAHLYILQGRVEEAERTMIEIIEAARQMDDPNLEIMTPALTNLAVLRSQQGRFAEAIPLLEECLAMTRAQAGDDHPTGLVVRLNLAAALTDAGRADEAEGHARETLTRMTAVHGPAHPYTVTARKVLVDLLNAQGRTALDDERPAGALPPLTEAVELLKAEGPPQATSELRWRAQLLLAQAMGEEGAQLAEAERILVEAAEHLAALPAPAEPAGDPMPEPPARTVAAWYSARHAELPDAGYARKAAQWAARAAAAPEPAPADQ